MGEVTITVLFFVALVWHARGRGYRFFWEEWD